MIYDRRCVRHGHGLRRVPRLISASHIERRRLTMRVQLRRFIRLTNAFSKKLQNLKTDLAFALRLVYLREANQMRLDVVSLDIPDREQRIPSPEYVQSENVA